DVGQAVLCKLINAFPTEVLTYHDDHPVDTLPLFSLRFGIRPALYVILKTEYLGRGGAMICANDRCGQFFVSERAGQRYCSAHGLLCQRRKRRPHHLLHLPEIQPGMENPHPQPIYTSSLTSPTRGSSLTLCQPGNILLVIRRTEGRSSSPSFASEGVFYSPIF